MTEISMRQGTTLPILQATVKDDNGDVIDLSTVTAVVFRMYNTDGVKIDNVDASVVSAVDGTIKYEWTAEDTDTVASYNAHFKLTFASGGIMIAPSRNTLNIEVWDDE
jgi:hypothetical protein